MKRKDSKMHLILLAQVSLMVLNLKEILCQMKKSDNEFLKKNNNSKDLLCIVERGSIKIENLSLFVNILILKRMSLFLTGMNGKLPRKN